MNLRILLFCLLVFVGCSRPEQPVEPLLTGPIPGTDPSEKRLRLLPLVGEGGLGTEDQAVQWLAVQLETATTVTIDVEEPRPLPAETFDEKRRRYDSVKVLNELKDVQKGQVLLAVTTSPLFSSDHPERKHAFGGQNGIAGLVSTYAVDPGRNGEAKPDPELAKDRFLKVSLRYIGELVYKLPRGEDPHSLLYYSLIEPYQVDQMLYQY